MLLICDDFSRFTCTYFMRQKYDAVTLFEQFLADIRVAETPSAVNVIRSDEGGELKGDFEKLCRRHNIRQEFTTADSASRLVWLLKCKQSLFFVDSKFRLAADCGLHATIGRSMRSTIRQLVLT